MKRILSILGPALVMGQLCSGATEKWSIHEWGTFTSLQDEAGNALGGINTDDEPLPPFVHQLRAPASRSVVVSPSDMPRSMDKGVPACHPDVTMRLETPVIYFHPPASAAGIQEASVHVTFRGGWLTEFFPEAVNSMPYRKNLGYEFGRLNAGTENHLDWNDLKIGGDWAFPQTTAHVWTSPRAVNAAPVQATNGESEKFLFYRGVGHLDAPLKVSRDEKSGQLLFQSQLKMLAANKPLPIKSLWLVNILPDGRIAFRPLAPLSLEVDSERCLLHTPASFTASDYDAGNLDKLKAGLQSALVAEGLFADEAQALLNTWELSYFKSAGLRVFFLVPRAWTDHYLPLEISQAADVNRVMVGRIELVTPRERELLARFSGYSTNQIAEDAKQLYQDVLRTYVPQAFGGPPVTEMRQVERDLADIYAGRKRLSSLVTVPETYQTYLALGRFRNALVLDEAKQHPTVGLTNFIATYRLGADQPLSGAAALETGNPPAPGQQN